MFSVVSTSSFSSHTFFFLARDRLGHAVYHLQSWLFVFDVTGCLMAFSFSHTQSPVSPNGAIASHSFRGRAGQLVSCLGEHTGPARPTVCRVAVSAFPCVCVCVCVCVSARMLLLLVTVPLGLFLALLLDFVGVVQSPASSICRLIRKRPVQWDKIRPITKARLPVVSCRFPFPFAHV